MPVKQCFSEKQRSNYPHLHLLRTERRVVPLQPLSSQTEKKPETARATEGVRETSLYIVSLGIEQEAAPQCLRRGIKVSVLRSLVPGMEARH